MTMKVPVLPIPALQCTSIGPIPIVLGFPEAVDIATDSCLALTSWRKFKTQPGSDGTP